MMRVSPLKIWKSKCRGPEVAMRLIYFEKQDRKLMLIGNSKERLEKIGEVGRGHMGFGGHVKDSIPSSDTSHWRRILSRGIM